MKVLPYFLEDQGLKCAGSISLLENKKVLSQDDAEIISDYMGSCVVINAWLSNIVDPITNRATIPCKLWSDGAYVWDSCHIHYVKNYCVRLPDEFVDHVKRQVAIEFDAKALSKDKLRSEFELIMQKIIDGDESYWTVYVS